MQVRGASPDSSSQRNNSVRNCSFLSPSLSALQGWAGQDRVADRLLHHEALEMDGHGDSRLAPDLQARLHHWPPAGVARGEAGRNVGTGEQTFYYHSQKLKMNDV